jgi:hypothetical protein
MYDFCLGLVYVDVLRRPEQLSMPGFQQHAKTNKRKMPPTIPPTNGPTIDFFGCDEASEVFGGGSSKAVTEMPLRRTSIAWV